MWRQFRPLAPVDVIPSRFSELAENIYMLIIYKGLDTPKKRRVLCMLFFEVLPFKTLAVSVNSKTSKKSMHNKTRRFFGVSRPKTAAAFLHAFL